MRLLLLFLLLLNGPAFAGDREEESKLALEIEERSVYAADLFRKTCFMHNSDRDALVNALDASYKRVEGGKRVDTLNFVQSTVGGEVWTVTITPKLVYTIVSELNGRCHVISPKSNAEKLHREIKNLAVDVRDSMSFAVVDYKGVTPDKMVQMSKFDVKAPDGAIIVTVTAATKRNPETDSAEGVLSTIAPQPKKQ